MKNKYLLIIVIMLIISGALFYQWHTQRPDPEYAYYIVIDEESNEILTYVSSVRVTVGDEYLTGDGRRYAVVRMEENRAFARRIVRK